MKKKENPEAELKRKESQLQSELKSLREYYLNEPTIYYKVGERVVRGNIKQANITEVLDDGKIYKIHENVTDHNYGHPVDYERDSYVIWNELLPYVDNSKEEKFFKENDLDIRYSQRDINSIISTSYHAGIDADTDYQRGNVWELEDKVKLIDSIFNHIDIGKFALIRRPWNHKGKLYEILDGKQRLNALVEFKENRFAYKGKTYFQLHRRDQSHFDNYPLQWGELSSEQRPVTDAQKYKYFLRLNTGGKPQDQKHIEYVEGLLKKQNG